MTEEICQKLTRKVRLCR